MLMLPLSFRAFTSEFCEGGGIMVSPTVFMYLRSFSCVDIAPLSSLQVELRGRSIHPTLTVMLIRSIV